MKEESKIILDRHRHHHTTFVNAQFFRHLNVHEREELLRVARDEFFGPGYSPDMFCGSCVGEFILAVYRAYDDWIKRQIKESDVRKALEELENERPGLKEFLEQPINVHTGFPANDSLQDIQFYQIEKK